jgi:hypothetical protein
VAELDMAKLRELAAELGFWPATTDPEDVERHRQQSAEADANYAAYLREYGPGGYKQHRWEHLNAAEPRRRNSYAGRSTRSARCSSSIRRSAASIGCADASSRPNRLSTTTTVPSRSSAVST